MEELTIQAVCGFGCGSSLLLRMMIDKVLKEEGITARTFCGDVATAAATPCDVIFCSEENADRLIDRAKVPVITVVNFNNPAEVKEKVMGYIQSLEETK